MKHNPSTSSSSSSSSSTLTSSSSTLTSSSSTLTSSTSSSSSKVRPLFVYQWLLEDATQFDANGNDHVAVNVRAYGLDENSNNILLEAYPAEFFPWLYIELLPGYSERRMIDHVSSLVSDLVMVETPRMKILNENEAYSGMGIHIRRTSINKKLYFYQDTSVQVYQLFFPSVQKRKQFFFKIKYKFEGSSAYKVHGYETSVNLQFLCQNKYPSVGWLEASDDIFSQPISKEQKVTRKSNEYFFSRDQLKIKANQEEIEIPVFRVLAFDLECFSAISTKFPDAALESDLIFQVGVSIMDEKKREEKHIFTLSKKKFSMKHLGIQTHTYLHEKALLSAFLDFIVDFNPIVLLTYNGYGFDIPYLKKRCELHHIDIKTRGMSKNREANYKELKWSSTAYSVQEFFLYDWDGRLMVDLMVIVKRNYKLFNYKLSTVSSYFLGDEITKDPMTVKDIFESYSVGFQSNDCNKIGRCAKYCVQDAFLCLLLYNKLCVLFELIEMARLVSVNLDDLMLRGQQFKVYSLVYRKCYNEYRLVDSFDALSDKDKKFLEIENYQGAHVFEPVVGRHSFILPFDFSSLYPSCLISYNICYSTLIPKEKVSLFRKEDYHAINWEDEQKNTYLYHFSKHRTGVIPALLQDLLQQRNITKKLLKHTKDPFLQNILDKRQLAYKLSSNSVYGALGVNVGYLPNKVGAMCCTAMGRKSIIKAAEFVKTKLNGEIIYGDSVVSTTPVFLQDETKEIKIFTIECFWNLYDKDKIGYPQFKQDDKTIINKEQILFNNKNIKIFSSDGVVDIHRLIRHRSNKKIYRVYTTSGAVSCTEDHSLLLQQSKREIKPSQLSVYEHQLLTLSDEDTGQILSNLVYQKESWNTIHYQKNNFVYFDQGEEDKYLAYLFFSYKKNGFPNCCYDFIMNDKGDIEYVIDLKNRRNRRKGLVLKVEEIVTNDDENSFVYDIETAVGNFHSSNGELIVKNTDSIYVKFKDKEDCKKLWKYALQVEKLIDEAKLFGSHMKLLFEMKIYVSFLILTKKRYICYTAGEDGKIDDKLSIRGVILARRDNSSFCRKIYEQVVRFMMDNCSYDYILSYVNSEILNLMQWSPKYSDVNEFIITKILNEDYKVKPLPNDVKKFNKRLADLGINKSITSEKEITFYNDQLKKGSGSCKDEIVKNYMERCLPAHKQLAIKQGKRGKPEASGSRIEFIYTDTRKDDDKLFNKIESPDYYVSFSDILRLDRFYYFKSITLCLDQLFTAVFPKKQLSPISRLYSFHLQYRKVIREIETVLGHQEIGLIKNK